MLVLLGGSSLSTLHLLKPYTSIEGLSTCGMGAQGLGCTDPLDKNNMDFSENNHSSKTKINSASK